MELFLFRDRTGSACCMMRAKVTANFSLRAKGISMASCKETIVQGPGSWDQSSCFYSPAPIAGAQLLMRSAAAVVKNAFSKTSAVVL